MKKLGKKGLTLVEVIASLAILGIIMTPLTSIFYMGYKNYFVENDRMTAQQTAKEVVGRIIDDLRAYENEYTEADTSSGKTLTIKDSVNFPEDTIVYTFEENQKMVFRNGTPLIDNPAVLITGFLVQETIPSGFDSYMIKISVTVKTGKSEEINLEGSYRRKYK